MAEAKPPAKQSSETKVERTKEQKKLDELGEHVTEGDDAQEAGYWGVRPTEIDDAEYTLATGPDAPYDEELGAI
jgi:hypothetical protein